MPGGGGADRREDGRRHDLPRRLGDIITPALDRIAGGDEARAYSAWARAVGEPVSGGTRPKAFRRGQLTIECASSVWANELTYLGPQILRRMDEVAPGHPVERFRFIVGRLPAPVARGEAEVRPDGAAAGLRLGPHDSDGGPDTGRRQPSGQVVDPLTAKEKCRHQRPALDVEDAARATTEGVHDGRLRAAMEAALRRSSAGPPPTPGSDTPTG
jgi:hypothetical protein